MSDPTITIGAQTTVMTFAQRNAIAQFWPDGGVNAVFHAGTNYVYAPGGGAAGMFGETIPDLTNWNSGIAHVTTTTNIPLGASTAFDSTFAGGGALYFDVPSGILIGLYHGEHNFGGGVFYSGHGLAYSTDFGVNWHKLGPVVLPQASFASTCGVEVGNGSLVSDGTFLYDYYSDMPQSGCPNSFASSITVARASIASVVAAAQAGTPFTSGPGNLFMKFTGSGTWNGLGVTDWGNQAGGGGAFTAFFGANDNLREPTVRFNAFVGQYVLTYVISDQSAIIMRFSTDGLTWGAAHTIVTNAGGTVYYPSMLNISGGGVDPQAIGQNFALFFIQPFGGVWTSTTIQRIAITLTPTGHLWDNILSPARAIDWGNAGLGANVPIPSSTWTQCGTTIAAGATAATINAALAACGTATDGQHQFVLLGPGNFNLTGSINLGAKSNLVLRGSGANSTFITNTTPGAGNCNYGGSAHINLCGNDITSTQNVAPANIFDWTLGYAQGSTSITLSNTTGIVTTVAGSPTMILLTQDEDGYTGFPATGSSIDNGNYFMCADGWNATGPTGCSDSGSSTTGSPGNANGMAHRWQTETVYATNVTGNVVTLQAPIRHPNWRTSQAPKAIFRQTIQNSGIENLSLDTTNGAPYGMAVQSCYKCWVSGVKFIKPVRGLYIVASPHAQIQNNYFTQSTGADPYGLDVSSSDDVLVVNNIFHFVKSSIVFDGFSTGSVMGYNYSINQSAIAPNLGNEGMIPSFWLHEPSNDFILYEGNIINAPAIDGIHGTHLNVTTYRNFFPGWESCGNGNCGSKTSKGYPNSGNSTYAIQRRNMNRYGHDVGNVLGTPGFHDVTSPSTGYKLLGNPGSGNSGFVLNPGAGGIPAFDPLVNNDTLLWGNYDVFTAKHNAGEGRRFCGGPTNTNWANANVCNSASEVPSTISPYPNPIPTLGDAGLSEPNMPPSFYLPSKPPWFPAAKPWPLIGPEVTGGNVGQCSGLVVPNPPFAGCATTSTSLCGSFVQQTAWGGHINSNPAMDCFLGAMGGNLDGSTGALPFDASVCYSTAAGSPSISFNPTTLNFGNQIVGSHVQLTVTVSNPGTATLNFLSVAIVGVNAADFAFSNGCGSSLLAGNSCFYNVTFTPSFVGTENASLQITDNASGSPHFVPLTGVGINVPPPPTNGIGIF